MNLEEQRKAIYSQQMYMIDSNWDGQYPEYLKTESKVADSGQIVRDTSIDAFYKDRLSEKACKRRNKLLTEVIAPLVNSKSRAVTCNEVCRAAPTREPIKNHNRSVAGDFADMVSRGMLVRDNERTIVTDKFTNNPNRAYVVCPENDVKPREPKVLVNKEFLSAVLFLCASVETLSCGALETLHNVIAQASDKLEISESEWSEMREESYAHGFESAYK